MNEVLLICSYRSRDTRKVHIKFVKHKKIEYLPEVEHIAKTIPRILSESSKIENGISISSPYIEPNKPLFDAQVETQYLLECSLDPSSEEKYVYTYHFLMADGRTYKKEFRFRDASISMTKRQTISPGAALEFDKLLPFRFNIKQGVVRYQDTQGSLFMYKQCIASSLNELAVMYLNQSFQRYSTSEPKTRNEFILRKLCRQFFEAYQGLAGVNQRPRSEPGWFEKLNESQMLDFRFELCLIYHLSAIMNQLFLKLGLDASHAKWYEGRTGPLVQMLLNLHVNTYLEQETYDKKDLANIVAMHFGVNSASELVDKLISRFLLSWLVSGKKSHRQKDFYWAVCGYLQSKSSPPVFRAADSLTKTRKRLAHTALIQLTSPKFEQQVTVVEGALVRTSAIAPNGVVFRDFLAIERIELCDLKTKEVYFCTAESTDYMLTKCEDNTYKTIRVLDKRTAKSVDVIFPRSLWDVKINWLFDDLFVAY